MNLDSRFLAHRVSWLCALLLAACGSDSGEKHDPGAAQPAGTEAAPPPAMAGSSAAGAAGMSTATAPGTQAAGAGSSAAGAAGMNMAAPNAGSSGSSGMPPTAAPAGSDAPATPMAGSPAMPAADTGAPQPSAGCMSGSLKPGRTTGSIQSSGGNRTYIQYVPSSYDGMKPLPVVVDLHPFSVTASFAESSSGFRSLADRENYIYLAPNGMSGMWDAVGDKDEKFIRDLVGDLAMKGCVDLRRIYATGCSNGGAFSFLLMCTAEDIFAAVAPMCGTSFVDLDMKCMLDRPVSLMLRIGRQDTLNCWEGEGMVLDAPNVPMGTRVPCAKTVQKLLGEKNHCKGAIKTEGRCEFLGDCDQGTEIAICGESTGHVVYSTNTARDTWAFLKRFYKP